MHLTDEFVRPHFDSCSLVIIDMQNDFVLPEGSVSSKEAMAILPKTVELAEAFRTKGKPIAHVVRLYRQDGSNAEACRRAALQDGQKIVVPESWGAQVAEGLLPAAASVKHEELFYGEPLSLSPNECILYKPSWSAFFKTQLEWRLLDSLTDTVIISGTWFANCVRQSIYDAISLDYRVIAVRDCIAGITDKDCADLEKVGCSVMTADEVAAAI